MLFPSSCPVSIQLSCFHPAVLSMWSPQFFNLGEKWSKDKTFLVFIFGLYPVFTQCLPPAGNLKVLQGVNILLIPQPLVSPSNDVWVWLFISKDWIKIIFTFSGEKECFFRKCTFTYVYCETFRYSRYCWYSRYSAQ